MTIQAANDKATAVIIDNGNRTVAADICAARHPTKNAVLHRHTLGAWLVENPAHVVIDAALAFDAHLYRVGGIGCIQFGDIGPCFRVDKAGIVRSAHAFSQGRVKLPNVLSTSASEVPFISTWAINPRFCRH